MQLKRLFVILLFLYFYFAKSQAFPAFMPVPFASSQCNNLMGNYNNQWKPSHGSPNVIDLGCGNKVVRLYSKNDNITTRKSEGVFIDLNNIGVNIDTSKKYKIIVSYRYSLPNNPNRAINFDVYLANGMTEKSNNNCDEETFPSVSEKMKILTFNNGEVLQDTYTCQVKSKEQGQIIPNKSYKYLWITSNLNTSLNLREYVDIDKIEMYYDGNSGSGSNDCNLPPPTMLKYSNLTDTSVRLEWNEAVGTGLWYDIRLYNNSTGMLVYSNNYHFLQKDYTALSPDTPYTFTVAHACLNNYENNDVKAISFRTQCTPDLIINDPVIKNNIYQASNSIVASSNISDGLLVKYKAKNYVSLQPGFSVKATDSNSLFHAYNGDCTGSPTSSQRQNGLDSLDLKSEERKAAISEIENYFGKINDEKIISNSNFEIYPNPASTYFDINAGNEKVIYWEMYDLAGKLIQKGNTNRVNVRSISDSNYLINITFENRKVSRKIIVKH
ncbi:3-coathanger stack domain-containing protein [Chryseobacterium sp.]|uniref:3-coathanger stack domain-containing protein n=1 Tax=Chryseobacterium sp. TaxID=1871047 RepID=UPI0035AD79C2